MLALSKFSFISNYNKEKLTRQEAYNNGLTSIDIKNCDKNNDGEVTIDEILTNTAACNKIIAKINQEQANIINSIKSLKGEKVKAETEEKTAEKTDKKPEGFRSFLKQAPRFGDNSKFSIAA